MTKQSPSRTTKTSKAAMASRRGLAGLQTRHSRVAEKVKALKIQNGLLTEYVIELQFEIELIMKTLQVTGMKSKIRFNQDQGRLERVSDD